MKILTAWLRHYLPSIPVDDLQLAEDLTLRGIAVEGVHPLAIGHLFEMDITTNRVDAMNHYGIAREAATIYNLPLAPLLDPSQNSVILSGAKDPRISLEAAQSHAEAAPTFPIRIEAKDLCGRFTAQILRNVTIAPSTGPISEFFTLIEQKQISNAVDASNFTLLGMGHPTHAFDLDKIEGAIIVRLARKGEKLKLLDGSDRILDSDDLIIADDAKALGLAGVMGGFDSMITPETKNILVESAWFSPAAVRRSSRRHLLHTDASHRFERGADIAAAPIANRLVSQLILQSGGHIEGALIDILIPEIAAQTSARPPISLSVAQVQRHLGETLNDTPETSALTPTLINQYLTSLGCILTSESAGAFSVKLPSWRLDLEREIDLIEEVARVYGYNRFANTLPTPGIVIAQPLAAAESAVRTRLLALGYSESVSSTFASQADSDLFYTAASPDQVTAPLENPLSEEASLLRPSLVPGMVTMLAHNLNRDVKDVRLFEQGHTFAGKVLADSAVISQVIESPQLTLGLTGTVPATSLHTAADAPIFELKGALESILSLFTLPGGPSALTFTTMSTPPWLQQGRAATVLLNNTLIGHFGELAASETQKRKLRQPIYLAQLDLAAVYALPLKKITAHDLSRFQAVERDFSFTFPDAIHWHTIASAIEALAIPELQSIKPVEIWRDAKKFPGVHSLLINAIFQSHDRTLRDDELTRWHSDVITALTTLGGTLRS